MTQLILLVSVLVMLGTTVWLLTGRGPVQDKEVETCWRRVAEALGLEYSAGSRAAGPAMAGQIGEATVQVDSFRRVESGERQHFTRVVVGSGADLQGAGKRPRRTFNDILDLLNRSRHKRIVELASKHGVTVARGRLRAARPGLVFDPGEIARLIRLMVINVDRLGVDTTNIPSRLAINIRDKTLSKGDRRKMLLVLLEQYADSPEAQAIAKATLNNADPTLRLPAAIALRREGLPVLAGLAANPEVAQELRVKAVSTLLQGFPAKLSIPHVRTVLMHPDPRIARTAVQLIGHLNFRVMVPDLARRLGAKGAARGGLLGLIVETLAEIGDVSIEPTLIQLIKHPDASVCCPAADALARLGTQRAVEPLLRASTSLSAHTKLRPKARDAARMIKERLEKAEQTSA